MLQALDDPDEDLQDLGGTKGCSFCGGLGHRITESPKLDKDARKNAAGKKDSLAGNDGYGGIYALRCPDTECTFSIYSMRFRVLKCFSIC